MNLEEYYNYLVDYELFTNEELELVTNLNGYDEKTLDDALYVRTGYRDIEQYLEYEDRETYKEYYEEEEEEEEENE